MQNKDLRKSLEDLQGELADTLAEGVKEIKKALQSGAEPKGAAALLNVARQFLKDNGIESLPVPESPVDKLLQSLPFEEADLHTSH